MGLFSDIVTGIPGTDKKFDSVQDWWTGSSSASKQYQYQQNLDAANRAFNAKQAELAYERQKDFFAYQAAYNTPAKQMERLKQAGLNPHLVYGSGADAIQASTGTVHAASSSSGGSAPVLQNRAATAMQFLLDVASRVHGIIAEDRRLDQADDRLALDAKKVSADVDRINADIDKTTEQTRDIREGLSSPYLKYFHRHVADPLAGYVSSPVAKIYDAFTGAISGKSAWQRFRDAMSFPIRNRPERWKPKNSGIGEPAKKPQDEQKRGVINIIGIHPRHN